VSLKKYSLFVLIYNVFVILIGAFVRATGSGAGCGAHWPSCNGEIVSSSPQLETIIEFTHRMTSGLTILFILILVIWVFKTFQKKSKIRFMASMVFLFIIIEAIVGAGLVLFELTAENSSLTRAIVIAVHLVNTFLLLASNTLLYEWIRIGEPGKSKLNKNGQQLILIITILFIVLGATGAITALGDTLFPATSLLEGIQQDVRGEHFLLELRVYHPMIAVLIGLGVYLIYSMWMNKSRNSRLNHYFKILAGLFISQLILGLLNVILLAPIWMQIVHLLFADIIWITLVLWINQIIYYGFAPSSPD
jgi:heme A synthase